MDIDDDLLRDLNQQVILETSCQKDLIEKYIRQGLDKELEDNMQSINIPNEIMEMIKTRCRQIKCSPEKLIHSILYDYLKRVESIPTTIDKEKILNMLEHDNPNGDDTLKKLRQLGDVGWD